MVGIRPLLLAILMLALLPAGAAADTATQIIVKREPGLSAAERRDIRADADVRFVESLPLPRTEVVASAPGDVGDALRDLNADPDVVYAERDRPTQTSASDDPEFNWLWGLENRADAFSDFAGITEVADADIDAPEAWAKVTGAGLIVAVTDTGADLDHPDLAAQLIAGQDYVDDDDSPEDELDADGEGGHGTHVSGTIAAVKDNQAGVVGVAPGAVVHPLRVLDENGDGLVSDAIAAYHDAGDNGDRILNASLGGVGAITAERDVINANSSVLFVVAAGNSGANNDVPTTAEYPCSYDLANVLCVGASRPDDRAASFSNYGARSVDLFAPGYGILSTVPEDGSVPEEGYDYKSGTSMATPHVAGAAALVMEAAPSLSPVEVKAVLLQSGDYKPALGGLSVTGRRLNADAAVDLALNGGPRPDADGDGFDDTVDACPSQASSQMANGCPDHDRDGRTDSADNCPTVLNSSQTDADGDGVGDACDSTPRGHDNDGDGKPRLDDACPDQYGTLPNGCPAPTPPPPAAPADSDGDRRPDSQDACPLEPAVSANGCPIAQVASLSATPRKRGTRRSARIRVTATRAATLSVTLERKKDGRWVRVTRRTIVGTSSSFTVSRLKRGPHRVRVSISSSAGTGSSVAKSFRVR
jgi:subtilisin family serine protease